MMHLQPAGLPGESYLSISQLRKRGWTRGLIERFLGAPDEARPNPHVRRGRPMQLFSAGRVEVIECDPWFCVESVESRRRAALVDVAVRSKSEALLRLVAVAHITLPSWSAEQLVSEALESFGRPADEETGLRQQLSVLMREAGACEWLLDDYFWHPGIRQARIALRRRMLCAAIEQFPHLGAVALVWAKRENGNAEIQIDMVLG